MVTQGQDVDERTPEQQVVDMSQQIMRALHTKPTEVTRFIIDCSVDLGHKVATYAMLIGVPCAV